MNPNYVMHIVSGLKASQENFGVQCVIKFTHRCALKSREHCLCT